MDTLDQDIENILQTVGRDAGAFVERISEKHPSIDKQILYEMVKFIMETNFEDSPLLQQLARNNYEFLDCEKNDINE